MNLRALLSIALYGSIFLAIVLFIGFAVVSAFLSGVQSGNWILVLLSAAVAVLGLLWLLDKRFRNRFPFLTTLPSRSMNDRIRHRMRLLFSRNEPSGTAQTGRQVAVATLWLCSPFIFILALAGIISLFRPVSANLMNLVGQSLAFSTVTAALNLMTLRLKRKPDLISHILSVAIYVPIVMSLISIFPLWTSRTDDDPFHISRDLIILGYWGAFGITISFALIHLIRKPTAPAPAFTTHPLYRRIEMATSLASLAIVAIIWLLSS